MLHLVGISTALRAWPGELCDLANGTVNCFVEKKVVLVLLVVPLQFSLLPVAVVHPKVILHHDSIEVQNTIVWYYGHTNV